MGNETSSTIEKLPVQPSAEKPKDTETSKASETLKTEETAKAGKNKKQARPKRKKKLQFQISVITLIPIALMGVLFLLFGLYCIRLSAVEETFVCLRGVAVMAADHFSAIEGIYHMDHGELYCGDVKMSDEMYFLEGEKRSFGTELSIFYGNNRVMTTMVDENGKRRLGTVLADSRIVTEVFKGNIVSTEKNIIGKERYLCVYVPIYNKKQVVGMVGSAMSLANFYEINRQFYVYIGVITCLTALVTFLMITVFSRRLVRRLIVIRDYMEGLVEKQTAEQNISPVAFSRNDEIASLARHAQRAGNSIKTLMGTDPLTGLYNRRAGRQYLTELWEKSHKNFEVFSIVIGDLDHFKDVNDKYGHDVGDTVLMKISAIIERGCKENGFAIRWGGEEFLMGFILPRDETCDIIKNISKDIKREAFFAGEGIVFHMSMTFGVATFTGQDNIDAVIKAADDNLYIGKNQGRDCIIS